MLLKDYNCWLNDDPVEGGWGPVGLSLMCNGKGKGKGGLARPLRICACVPLEEILWLPGVRGDTLTCRPRLDNSPKHLPLFTVTFNHYLTLKCKSSHKSCVEEVTAEWVSKALPRHICCLKHGSQQTISARTGQTSVLKGKF